MEENKAQREQTVEEFKLKQSMLKLKEVKAETDNYMRQLEEKQQIFDTENEELIKGISHYCEAANSLITDVKELALAIEAETGETKLAFGVEVKSWKTWDIDEVKAFDWAKDKKMCLKLDASAFKKFAKADPKSFDFVNMKLEKKVSMPTKIGDE